MTFRLVGLMSLVLLLSLSALAFLMNSYQAEVMEEVTRTVSSVGRATLQSFEFKTDVPPELLSGAGPHSDVILKVRADHPPLFVPQDGKPGPMVLEPAGSAAGTAPGTTGAVPYTVTTDEKVKVFHLKPEPGKPAEGRWETTEPDRVVVVRVEGVRAEANPTGDTLLKIPTQPLEGAAPTAAGGSARWVYSQSESGPGGTHTARKEIVLPIPTREFHGLFANFRRRTLYLFLGVFLVGTLLSAGLATRFTRPVRRLDAGLKRLSEGDLDARVEEGGRDEIGRLGRVFNEMAGRLRAGREREREMRRREKLSALGRLAAGVAHDVRNPLHSIGLTLQNLQDTARPGEPDRQATFDRSVAVIRDEIRRLDRLVENFLRFARSDRAARVGVDLTRLARETVQLVEGEARQRGIQVLVTGEGAPAEVVGDPESIRSSILNLVLNSFEAMPQGGTLSIAVREAPGETVLEVADTGRGIPAEDQEKVFDFAYTTREEGHGLGLAMVHQVVVEDHGGRVSLESRPGEGTRIRLAFPIGSAPEPESAS